MSGPYNLYGLDLIRNIIRTYARNNARSIHATIPKISKLLQTTDSFKGSFISKIFLLMKLILKCKIFDPFVYNIYCKTCIMLWRHI